jgi:hypothetical protein
MANALRQHTDEITHPPRRYLAPNVIALHAEDRPPVVNVRRRGRYPACVKRIEDIPRLYVGVLCELRTQDNAGVPVRIKSFEPNGDACVEAIGHRLIHCNDQSRARIAYCRTSYLFRTVFGASHV